MYCVNISTVSQPITRICLKHKNIITKAGYGVYNFFLLMVSYVDGHSKPLGSGLKTDCKSQPKMSS